MDYAPTGCADHGLWTDPDCGWVFPLFPNVDSTLHIAADTATFTYDVMGNVLTANNRYAKVRRTYNANGSVATDSLRLRNYTSSAASRMSSSQRRGERVTSAPRLPQGYGRGAVDEGRQPSQHRRLVTTIR